MTDAAPLNIADAKTHMVVNVSIPGEPKPLTRYLYKDAIGWYVLGAGAHGLDNRHYVRVTEDGTLEGVTL